MNYAEWLETVPSEITNDPIWKLEIYRLALFAGDIDWEGILKLAQNKLMFSIADQLYRSLGCISGDLTEGFSRSNGLGRTHFIEISLGPARESRDWYNKARHVFSAEVVKHRMELLTRIISMLTPMIPHQHKHASRNEQAEYNSQPSDFSPIWKYLSHNPLTTFYSPGVFP